MRSSLKTVLIVVAAAAMSWGCSPGNDDQSANDGSPSQTSSSAVRPEGTSTLAEGPATNDMRFNPCKLVTAADLATVLGGSFSAIEKTDNPPIVGSFSERNCGYTGPNDRTVQIQTEVDDKPSGTAWKASVDVADSNLGGHNAYEEVTGVGDHAFYSSSATIFAHKGVAVVTINFLGEETTSTTKPLLKALAAKAMSRVNG